MEFISKDNPFYFLTSVTHKRLPVFQKDKLKTILCDAFDEARTSCGLSIFAYAVMPDHYHIVTDSKLKQKDVLRYLNGISARRVLGHLKDNGYASSLEKLRTEV